MGSCQAAYELGMLYYEGNEVKQDAKLALSYFEKAAEAGLVDAQAMAGGMYWQGVGTKEDKSKGYEPSYTSV